MSKEESKTTSRKVKNPAAKGKQFERDIANALGHIFPEAQRMLEYQASNVIGVDIEGTYPFMIQCKNRQNYVPISTIDEVKTQYEHEIPVLITKGIRMEAMAVLPFQKLVTLLEIIYGHRPLLKPVNTDRHESTAIAASSSKFKPQEVLESEWEEVPSPFKIEHQPSISDFI